LIWFAWNSTIFCATPFLQSAPIVPVSAKTGAGLVELKQALVEQARQVIGKDSAALFVADRSWRSR